MIPFGPVTCSPATNTANVVADIRHHTATVDASRTARALDAAADVITGLIIYALDRRHTP